MRTSPHLVSDEKVIDRIGKLLRIADRDPGPQGESARRMAHKLMAIHGFDVEVPVEETRAAPTEVVFYATERSAVWRGKVAEGLGRFLDLEYGIGPAADKYYISLRGDGDVLREARTRYDYLCCVIENLCAEAHAYQTGERFPWPFAFSRRRFDLKRFAEGLAYAVGDSLEEPFSVEPVVDNPHNLPAVSRAKRRAPREFDEPEIPMEPMTLDFPRPGDPSVSAGYETGLSRVVADTQGLFEPLDVLRNIPAQALVVLRAHRVETVGDLLRFSRSGLTSFRGIGIRTAVRIEKALLKMNLRLRPSRSLIE